MPGSPYRPKKTLVEIVWDFLWVKWLGNRRIQNGPFKVWKLGCERVLEPVSTQEFPPKTGSLSERESEVPSLFQGFIRLMVQKSGKLTSWLIVHPIIYRFFLHPRWLALWFLKHRQETASSLRLSLRFAVISSWPAGNPSCKLHMSTEKMTCLGNGWVSL